MEQRKATSEQKSRRRGRPRVPGPIEDKIKEYALMGWTPPQIHQQLSVDFPNIKPLPVLKTVRLIAKPYRPSKYWSLAEADPDDAALVLPVLATAVGEHRVVPPISANVANWITRVCRAAPGIPPSWALDVALNYASRTQDGLAVDGLDLLLAFRPWESEENYLQYFEAVKQMRPDYFGKSAVVEWFRLGNVRPSSDQLLKRRLFRLRRPLAEEILGDSRDVLRKILEDPITCGLGNLDTQASRVFAHERDRKIAQMERLIPKLNAKVRRMADELERNLVRRLQDGGLDEEQAAVVKETIAKVKAVIDEVETHTAEAETLLDQVRGRIAQVDSLMRAWVQAEGSA